MKEIDVLIESMKQLYYNLNNKNSDDIHIEKLHELINFCKRYAIEIKQYFINNVILCKKGDALEAEL